jgi:Zn ribbon nucleic-acid-binding protein
LTPRTAEAKLSPIPVRVSGKMSSIPFFESAPSAKVVPMCKHPQVKVVAREDDVEYVECSRCGEVFDSSEFHDMQIEETALDDDDE